MIIDSGTQVKDMEKLPEHSGSPVPSWIYCMILIEPLVVSTSIELCPDPIENPWVLFSDHEVWSAVMSALIEPLSEEARTVPS